jgi:hypothetical protein
MRNIYTHILYATSFIGIVCLFATLIAMTGFLFGFLKPLFVGALYVLWADKIHASPTVWLLATVTGWFIAGYSAWILRTFRNENPITIIQDDSGAVEIAPSAISGLANAVVIAQGGMKPHRTEFARRQGKPVLQVWTDLVKGNRESSPVEWGESLKGGIEKRLKEDFCLDNVKVEVIHQPATSGFGR